MNRSAVEAELSDSELAALRDYCRLASVRFDSWPMLPALRFWGSLALMRLIERFMAAGITQEQATNDACTILGMSSDAHTRSVRRLRRRTKGTKCPQ